MGAEDLLFDDIIERELFIELVADGASEINAGFEVGWTPNRTTRNLADPGFRECVEFAKNRANGTIEQAMFKLGKNGNLGAMQMWLYNRAPERWKDVRRIEVKNDTTINLGLVGATKQAIIELMRSGGPAALQPAPADDIIDGEVVDEDDG